MTQTRNYSYAERIPLTQNSTAKKLFSIMEAKKSNLIFSADITSSTELLKLVDAVGPHICALKTHIDIVKDFTPALSKQLKKLAEKHNFLLFEDRKFADIGNTVMHQCKNGIYQIASWANIVNAHSLPGSGIVDGLVKAYESSDFGILLLAQMSSKGNLLSKEYAAATVAMANQYPGSVIGFISQEKVSDNPAHIHMTPGVRLAKENGALGQQYNTPYKALFENETDCIIVGSGIYNDDNPQKIAQKYKESGWSAYQENLKK